MVLGRVRMGLPSSQRCQQRRKKDLEREVWVLCGQMGKRLKIITSSLELPPARAPSNLFALKPSPSPVGFASINTLLLI